MTWPQRNLFSCVEPACLTEFARQGVEFERLNGNDPLDVPFHCSSSICHNIAFGVSKGGQPCSQCEKWLCKSCVRVQWSYNPVLKQKVTKHYCTPCLDRLMVSKNPRPNFQPDAPVEIEYDLPPQKKKTQEPQPQLKRTKQEDGKFVYSIFTPPPSATKPTFGSLLREMAQKDAQKQKPPQRKPSHIQESEPVYVPGQKWGGRSDGETSRRNMQTAWSRMAYTLSSALPPHQARQETKEPELSDFFAANEEAEEAEAQDPNIFTRELPRVQTATYVSPWRKMAMQNKQVQKQPQEVPVLDDGELTLLQLAFLDWPLIVPSYLAQKHPHESDLKVRLDETNGQHQYYADYGNGMESENNKSTSSIAHKYQTPYDAFQAVATMFEGKHWGPYHPKWGKYFSNDEAQLAANMVLMLAEWKQNNVNAIQRGKFVHFLIECHCNKQLDLEPYREHAHIRQYLEWREEYWDPVYEDYRTEKQFVSAGNYRRVGTCDLLGVRRDHPPPEECDDTLILVMRDWKCAPLKRKGFFDPRTMTKPRHMTGPCESLDDCNVSGYTIQQNDYATLAAMAESEKGWLWNERYYKHARIDDMQLIGLDEDNFGDQADIVQLEHIPDIIDALWYEREQEVADWEAAGRPRCEKHHEVILSKEETLAKLTDLIRTHDATTFPRPTKQTPEDH